MYSLQSFVRYGANGVFQIKEIVSKQLSRKEVRQYYVLERVFGVETRITTPIDNPNLRAILSKAEMLHLLEELPKLSSAWIEDRHLRSDAFRSVLASNDMRQLAQMIQTIYWKKREKEQAKKQLSNEDLEFFAQAEAILCEEIALALGMEKEAVPDYLLSHVKEE